MSNAHTIVNLPEVETLLATLVESMRPHVAPAMALVGIHTGGVWLAERLHAALGLKMPLGSIDVSFHRDDYSSKGLRRGAALAGAGVLCIATY